MLKKVRLRATNDATPPIRSMGGGLGSICAQEGTVDGGRRILKVVRTHGLW